MKMSILFVLVLILYCTSLVSSDNNDDENALLKIRKQLGDPDILSGWVKGFQYCQSYYNEPMGGAISIGCTNGTSGRVRSFSMVNLINISAPFPDAICRLTELDTVMVITVWGLYGTIPSCVTKLAHLNYFQVVSTAVSGSVPEFRDQTNLTEIILSQNHFLGTIPSSFSTLPNLQILMMASNHLTGTIPSSLSALQNIHLMDLSNNFLTGSIPTGLFCTSPKPSYSILMLSYNNLTGEIPKSLGTADLTRLYVNNNQLSGDASFLFGKQKRADAIILADNNFEFDLSYVEFSDKIMNLDISHNKIYGKIPESIVNATDLYYPDFSFNKLCGAIPQGGIMSRMSDRPQFFANNSCLCGNPLPPC